MISRHTTHRAWPVWRWEAQYGYKERHGLALTRKRAIDRAHRGYKEVEQPWGSTCIIKGDKGLRRWGWYIVPNATPWPNADASVHCVSQIVRGHTWTKRGAKNVIKRWLWTR